MSTISNVSMRAIPTTQADLHHLMTFALPGGLILGATLCVASFGLDLSAGVFERAITPRRHTTDALTGSSARSAART